MSTLIENFRKRVGFTKTPMNPGDHGESFAGFVSFANGNSAEAKAMREDFGRSRDVLNESMQVTAAAYIDYIIENYWGEAALTAPGEKHD